MTTCTLIHLGVCVCLPFIFHSDLIDRNPVVFLGGGGAWLMDVGGSSCNYDSARWRRDLVSWSKQLYHGDIICVPAAETRYCFLSPESLNNTQPCACADISSLSRVNLPACVFWRKVSSEYAALPVGAWHSRAFEQFLPFFNGAVEGPSGGTED